MNSKYFVMVFLVFLFLFSGCKNTDIDSNDDSSKDVIFEQVGGDTAQSNTSATNNDDDSDLTNDSSEKEENSVDNITNSEILEPEVKDSNNNIDLSQDADLVISNRKLFPENIDIYLGKETTLTVYNDDDNVHKISFLVYGNNIHEDISAKSMKEIVLNPTYKGMYPIQINSAQLGVLNVLE
jgi:hypothetical protein